MTKRWYHGLFRSVAGTRIGSFVLKKTLPGMDRWMFRRTRGQRSMASMLTGLPVVTVTTIGAKSGKKRSTPLLAVPHDHGSYILIASNFARPKHPAWYHNLRAHPDITVTHQGRERDYRARRAEGDERQLLWQRAAALYPGYDGYARRTERTIPVIVLEPRGG